MIDIPVYKAELDCGLADVVKANTSLSFLTVPTEITPPAEKQRLFRKRVKAGIEDFSLHYLYTILVTAGWNKNSDIFDRTELWMARHTAEDKPFNLRHVNDDIIGHITGNWAVDENYKEIADDTPIDNLPDKFHILTSNVIYKLWENAERQDLINKILSEISAGGWYVSMECVFSNFDYGIIGENGERRVIARNEESAYLTKHLRQYGGTGKYENYTLGRVLRNITFVGKGLVENPANPESLILNDQIDQFKSIFANVGYIKSEGETTKENLENPMSDQVKSLEADLEAARNEYKTLQAKYDEINVKAYTDKISSLEAQVKSLTSDLAAAGAKAKDVEKEKDDMKAKCDEAVEAKNEAEKNLATLQSQVKADRRVQSLISLGAPADEAKSIVAEFANLSDEQFSSFTKHASAKWRMKDEDKDKKKDKAEEVFTSASVEKETVVTTTSADDLESTRAELVDFLSQ